jgi:PAS domain-containing protein
MQTHHFPDEDDQIQLRELRELVDSTADAALAVEGAGVIVAWNSAAAVMFGAPVNEAVGKPGGQILHGAEFAPLIRASVWNCWFAISL